MFDNLFFSEKNNPDNEAGVSFFLEKKKGGGALKTPLLRGRGRENFSGVLKKVL